MVTLKDLAEDWIKARSALKQQIKFLESDLAFPQHGLAVEARDAIVLHLKNAVAEFDALLKENPNA